MATYQPWPQYIFNTKSGAASLLEKEQDVNDLRRHLVDVWVVVEQSVLTMTLSIDQWRRYQSCITAFKTSANTVNVNTFLKYSKRLKHFLPAFRYSLNLFLKLGTTLFCGKFPHVLATNTFWEVFFCFWTGHFPASASIAIRCAQDVVCQTVLQVKSQIQNATRCIEVHRVTLGVKN